MAESMPIGERIPQRTLTGQELMTFARSTAQALARAHDQEMAFGSLSPETILIDSHHLGILPDSAGKPQPLEVYQAADLRALGQVLYLAACGQLPDGSEPPRPVQISQELWLVITRLLTDDFDRIHTAQELTVTLEAVAQMRLVSETSAELAVGRRKARLYVILASIALLLVIYWIALMASAPTR